MMPFTTIKNILDQQPGCSVEIIGNQIEIGYEGKVVTLDIDNEWKKALRSFDHSNQFEFDLDIRQLVGPKSVENGISQLNQDIFFGRPVRQFESPRKRKVEISTCSKRFALFFFCSTEYSDFFEAIVARKLKRERLKKFQELFWFPPTVTFSLPRKTDRSKLLGEAIPAMEACLFKLAVEKGECWDFSKRKKQKLKSVVYGVGEDDENMSIPLAKYDSNMLKYFKVAISSQFPSQSFLAFYHVLEYNFLSVSDETLHGRLRSHIHSTGFSGTDEQLEKVINIIKKHTDKSDETEMLMRVLRKYVDECQRRPENPIKMSN